MAENGRIPDSALSAIPGGGRLLTAVAARWLAIRAEVLRLYEWTPTPTGPLDSYRPYSGNYYAQLETFQRRYSRTRIAGRPTKVWNGVTYWLRPGQATAAVPGTSNHGWACAVDVTGLGGFDSLRYRQFATVANRYGWTNTEGRKIGEPWHWVDVGTAHLVANGLFDLGAVPNVPTINAPTLIEEDDMTPDQEAALDEARNAAKQASAHAGEIRRMVGVLLGWGAPATANEVVALDDMRQSPREARRMLGVLLGWQPPQGPEATALSRLYNGAPPTVDIDEAALAQQIADAIPADLAKQVADELAKRLTA